MNNPQEGSIHVMNKRYDTLHILQVLYIHMYFMNITRSIFPNIAQVNIKLDHIFSAEIDDRKRAYILDAFQDVHHVFSDVAAFSKGIGYCYRCKKKHPISIASGCGIHLLIVGPSCKDLSSSVRIIFGTNDSFL